MSNATEANAAVSRHRAVAGSGGTAAHGAIAAVVIVVFSI